MAVGANGDTEGTRTVSLGSYYDLYAYYRITDDGRLYIEVGWYKKKANSSSWNGLDATGQISIDGQQVYSSKNVGFDMRTDEVGTYKSFWSTTVALAPVELVAFFDANMSSGNVTSGTITWMIAVGLVRIFDGTDWVSAVPYIFDGGSWVQALPYIHDGSVWNIAT